MCFYCFYCTFYLFNIVSHGGHAFECMIGVVPCVCLSGCVPCLCLPRQEHPQLVGAPLCTASHSVPGEHLWIYLRTAALPPACVVWEKQTRILVHFQNQEFFEYLVEIWIQFNTVPYLSIDLPLMVSHVSLSSASRFSRCCLSWPVRALSWRLRPFFDVASYMGLFDLSSFWNS